MRACALLSLCSWLLAGPPPAPSSQAALLAARTELRAQLAAPSHCTGHAFIVFRRLADAARCVRHFELIRRHEREGVADNVRAQGLAPEERGEGGGVGVLAASRA